MVTIFLALIMRRICLSRIVHSSRSYRFSSMLLGHPSMQQSIGYCSLYENSVAVQAVCLHLQREDGPLERTQHLPQMFGPMTWLPSADPRSDDRKCTISDFKGFLLLETRLQKRD